MKTVLVTGKIAEVGLRSLKEFAQVKVLENPTSELIAEGIADADAVLHKIGKLTGKVLNKAKKLKIIARHGVGLDDIDLDYVRQQGIWLTITVDANTNAVAEYTIGLILAAARNIVSAHLDLSLRKKWDRESLMGEELWGKTLGLIGYGKIGKRVAELVQSFGMRVVAYDPYSNNKIKGVEFLSLIDTVRKADFLSIHCPLTEETRGLINSEVLSFMKPSAFLINTARGGIVEEETLIEVLENHKIRGAALDVYSLEPVDMRNRLLELDNVITTPHIAAMSKQAQEKMAIMAADEIKRVLVEGQKPVFSVW
ncbi:D-isomer specific 2-hydroxyacid dehydrogenase,catalytic domain [Moorella glycerini]|jgi:D-3-phosphoglycerate dehydrogenase|uniref:D-3-phosphoglycerate dehydrogenase n=1 Tax=Neomoorella stamsii TaxID=1266720 RepID=A0A9X7P7H8_9FIRM|nr:MULTISPECIES: hydroxyacid dehydrogenase [Moorella]PRR77501.1 D-3-phosphoglycerate dehydrogenase [Moorella stamsii]CEP68250.1 D-isomer specific 2-hydroxyacid dehydrogenase,catalytic domain [Moorella glycerini]